MIEPTFGMDRSFLAVLFNSYCEEKINNTLRVFLKLPSYLAPYKTAVFPLVANKEELVNKAKQVYEMLKTRFWTVWDERGNIGKRYFAQDEIGTPFCITLSF